MKHQLARLFFIVSMACGALGVSPVQAAQTNAPASASKPEDEERQACGRNLMKIYAAIQAYQDEHKDLPNWLSDLVPQYLPDANVLVCPTCKRTGKTEGPPLADPKIASSYLFEFCPVPLGNLAPLARDRTRREWKRRQMGLIGSVVPIIRCRHHSPVLNVSFDGKLYEGPPSWETAFTNRISADRLTAAALFADEPAPKVESASRFPARDPNAGRGLIDLTKHYNFTLSEFWLGNSQANLRALPEAVQLFAGTQFDARGVIQLGGKALADKKYPAQITGIRLNQKCKRLHFLQAAALGNPGDEGKQVGSFFIHFAGNPARLELPVTYGRDTGDFQFTPGDAAQAKAPAPAWTSTAEASAQTPAKRAVRVFKMTWNNFAPDSEIESIDFVSTMSGPAPLLLAITAE